MSTQNKLQGIASLLRLRHGETGNPTRQGLARLLQLRSFIAGAALIGVIGFQWFAEVALPSRFLPTLLICSVAALLVGLWRLRVTELISNRELFGHLLIDVCLLVYLLFNTGGASNPLISYLLVLLAVSATLLPRFYVYSFAVVSIAVYSGFILRDLQLDHGGSPAMETDQLFQLHLVGMWFIFVVSSVLISAFITRMASQIRDREANLALAREDAIRNEQLVAIGTLAAGTAHTLGTPLSTMAVLLTELDKLSTEQLRNADIKDDISMLKQQVLRCKESLTQLIRYYNKREQSRIEVSLNDFVGDIRDYITNIHPAANVQFQINSDGNSVVTGEPSLRHAIINIIENGIKAANERVEVSFKVVADSIPHVEIAINDDGPGIPRQVMEKMGEPFISTRKESMGLGIFLANATVQRLGGSIEMFNLKVGGALTLIRLPLGTATGPTA